MRIFQVLFRNKRAPQDPKRVPLSAPRLPFALSNRVCTKRERARDIPFQQELQNLMTKLAQNDFNQSFCQNEIKALEKAQIVSLEQYQNEKSERRIGEIKPGPTLKPIPMNKYLKNFPISKMDGIEDYIKKKFAKQ